MLGGAGGAESGVAERVACAFYKMLIRMKEPLAS